MGGRWGEVWFLKKVVYLCEGVGEYEDSLGGRGTGVFWLVVMLVIFLLIYIFNFKLVIVRDLVFWIKGIVLGRKVGFLMFSVGFN